MQIFLIYDNYSEKFINLLASNSEFKMFLIDSASYISLYLYIYGYYLSCVIYMHMYTHFRYESIMLRCWHADPDQRPTFSQLQAEISTTLTIAAGYMDFSVSKTCTSPETDTYLDMHTCERTQNRYWWCMTIHETSGCQYTSSHCTNVISSPQFAHERPMFF